MEYHSDRFTDASLMIYKDDKLIALLPLNSSENQVYSHQGLTYGGLLVSSKLKFKEYFNVFRELLTYFSENDITHWHLKLQPKTYHLQPSDEMDYLLFLVKARLTRSDLASTIDLHGPFKIQSNRMEGVKKANKEGLSIKEELDFTSFWNEILLPNLERQHNAKPTHTLEEIEALAKLFPKQIRQFNVYHKERIVGGATIFDNKHHIHVQYISADTNKQQLGTLDFLFHLLITETFGDRRYFDFGISNENNGKQLNEGLLYWKECFGARSIVHQFYTITTANHKDLDTVFI